MTKSKHEVPSVAIRCGGCDGHGQVTAGGWLSYKNVDCAACEGAGILLVTKSKADELAYIAGDS